MLDNLMNLIKEQAGSAIIDNPAIPNDRNEEAIAATSQSITGGLQNLLSSGGVKQVLSLFAAEESTISSSPVTQQVSGNVIQDLMQKFNLDQGQATNIAGGMVPNILQNLVKKTNDPSDNSFDIQGIFNSLSGGRTGGMNIQGLLGKFAAGGLDKDGDGDVDMQDLMAMFSGGQGGGGGMLDNVKNLLGGR